MALTTDDLQPPEKPAAPTTDVRVVVVRAFCIDAQRQEEGTELTLPRALAMQVIGAGQAVRAPAQAEPKPKPRAKGAEKE